MIFADSFLLFRKTSRFYWILFPVFFVFSKIYLFAINFIKFCYRTGIFRSYIPKAKVISIGNITLGGTGKTPLVEWVAKLFIKNNIKTAIVIGGYKRPSVGFGRFDTDYFHLGDEAAMLKENLSEAKIYVGKDKVRSLKRIEAEGLDVAIVDDGFQHWRLHRDLDVVVIDSTLDLFNQYLLPLGVLREQVNSIKRAHIFFLTRTDIAIENVANLKIKLNKINPNAIIISSVYKPVCFIDLKTKNCIEVNSDFFKNKKVFILSGIANPLYFDKLVSDLKIRIVREFIFPDHHKYEINDVTSILQLADELAVDTLITTQKDAVRLQHLIRHFSTLNVFILKIELVITENEKEFSQRLFSVLGG